MSNKRFDPSKVIALQGKYYGTGVQVKHTPELAMNEMPLTDLPPLPPMLPAFNTPTKGDSTQLYTNDQMRAYGQDCYEQGALSKSNVATPIMLSALYEVCSAADYMDFDPDSRFGFAMQQVKAAIAKATGETQS